MRALRAGVAAALVGAGACAAPAPTYPTSRAPVVAAPERGPPLSALPGWAQDDHLAAFRAFRATCGAGRAQELVEACRAAGESRVSTREQARRFFEERFRAEPVANQPPGPGLLTAYFAPEYGARW